MEEVKTEVIAPEIQAELSRLLKWRAALEGQKVLLEEQIEQVKNEATPLLLALGEKTSYTEDGIGSLVCYSSSNSSISQDRLKKALLKRSIAASEVKEIMEEVVLVKPYTTVSFRKPEPPATE